MNDIFRVVAIKINAKVHKIKLRRIFKKEHIEYTKCPQKVQNYTTSSEVKIDQ